MTDPVTEAERGASRISIVVPAYNREDYLCLTLDSVRRPNAGFATARNRGFAATDSCSGYTIFLDSDDLWEPDSSGDAEG